jgi:hypothetical protein
LEYVFHLSPASYKLLLLLLNSRFAWSLKGLNDKDLPNYVDRAVPFFVASLFTEFMVSKWREVRKHKNGEVGNAGNNESPYTYFRANDSLNSLR